MQETISLKVDQASLSGSKVLWYRRCGGIGWQGGRRTAETQRQHGMYGQSMRGTPIVWSKIIIIQGV